MACALGSIVFPIVALVAWQEGLNKLTTFMGVATAICLFDQWRSWRAAKERSLGGDVCPAVVVSESAYLVATATDMTTGGGSQPVIKVMRQPLRGMTGGPPRAGMRLAAVCLYHGNPSHVRWEDVDFEIVHCATTNTKTINRIMASIGEEYRAFLEWGSTQIEGRPKKGRLYKLGRLHWRAIAGLCLGTQRDEPIMARYCAGEGATRIVHHV